MEADFGVVDRPRGADALDEFSEFVRARTSALLRTAYLLTGDQHAAEGLVQDAFARTHRAVNRLDGWNHYEAYTRTALYHLQVSRWRRVLLGGHTPAHVTSPVPSTSPSATADDGCPVGNATLFAAVQGDASAVQNLPQSLTGLHDPVCYQGYATALTTAPGADSSSVLFRYDQSTGVWSVIEYGGSMTCAAVPPGIVGHLPACFPG